MDLEQLVRMFALGLTRADARGPQAKSVRTERMYQPGIGPHTEPATIRLVMAELAQLDPAGFGHFNIGVTYPSSRRRKCDLVLTGTVTWAVEVKMARFRGDNGKPADETLMHLISPYDADRSALADCSKLRASGFPGRLAVLIYGFDYDDKPLDPAIDAFEHLAHMRVALGRREVASFSGLVHPVHRCGRVFGWEIERSL